MGLFSWFTGGNSEETEALQQAAQEAADRHGQVIARVMQAACDRGEMTDAEIQELNLAGAVADDLAEEAYSAKNRGWWR